MTRLFSLSPVSVLGISTMVLLALTCRPAGAEDWPYHRGPNQTGKTSESGWQTTWAGGAPTVAWKKNVGVGTSSVVVAGDRVVTIGNRDNQDVVSCFGAEDGSLLWEYAYDNRFEERNHEGGSAATPTIAGDLVYTLSYNGHVNCVNLSDGSLVWKRNLVDEFGGKPPRWKYAASPFVTGDIVILDTGSKEDSTLALDKQTGEKVWGAGSDGSAYASPVSFSQDGQEGVLMFKEAAMVAHNLGTGDEMWRIPWENKYDVNASSPTVIGDELYLSSGYDTGRTAKYKLGQGGPEQVWRNDELKTKMSSCVLHNGAVFGITEVKSRLLCLDQDSGEIRWEGKEFTQYGTLIIAGEHIVALTESGELVIVEANPDEFRELARAKVIDGKTWVTPAMANGRIYCRNNMGDLVVVDVRPDS